MINNNNTNMNLSLLILLNSLMIYELKTIGTIEASTP